MTPRGRKGARRLAAALGLALTVTLGSGRAWAGAPDAGPAPGSGSAPAAGPTEDPGLAALRAGDRAWWSGERRAARDAWRRALAIAVASPLPAASPVPASPTPSPPATPPPATSGSASARLPAPSPPALEAMARIRLLQLGGSLAPFVHEARLDRALAACPPVDPWCAIAAADWDLFLPPFTGADPRRAARAVAGSPLAGPAAARIAAATGDRRALDALPDVSLDGMGQGQRATGRRLPPAPGTWVLGLGLGGAPGAGVGVLGRYANPDFAWKAHRFELLAGADTRGGAFGVASLRTATRPAWSFGLAGSRAVGDVYSDGAAIPFALGGGRASAAVVPRWGGGAAQLGVTARVDVLDGGSALADRFAGVVGADGPALVAGPNVAVTLGSLATDGVRVAADTSFGAYAHLALGADWRAHPPLLGGTLALRAAITHVPTASPFYRLPTAGGADLLRGLPAGRYRAPTLAAGQAEYRRPIHGPLHGALFVDAAWIDGAHVTAGGGLRVVLPPDRENTTRLDVGFGAEGWGVVAAWGEAF